MYVDKKILGMTSLLGTDDVNVKIFHLFFEFHILSGKFYSQVLKIFG